MKNDNQTVELEIRQSEAIDAVLSTSEPVEMNDYEEVLLHHPENIEFHTARLPLLLNHDQNQQIGIVEGIRIQGGKLLGRLRLASDKQSQENQGGGLEITTLKRAGILQNAVLKFY